MFPAARITDPVSHDGKSIVGTIGSPLAVCGHMPVNIERKQAAHVGCTVMCGGTTTEAVVHPPIVPVGVAPCPGCSVSPPPLPDVPVPSPDENDDDDDGPKWDGETMKTFQIRLVGGGSLSASIGLGAGLLELIGAGGKLDGFVFEIRDPETGDIAEYYYGGGAPVLGGGTPIAGEWKKGGEFQDFEAPNTLQVDQFDGFFDIQTASASITPTTGASYIILGIKTWVSHENWWESGPYNMEIRGFDPGPSFQLGSLWELSESNGLFVEFGGITKGSVTAPSVAIPVQTSAPIVMGSKTVFIHGKPAAVWHLPGSVSCGAMLGPPPATMPRNVFIGV